LVKNTDLIAVGGGLKMVETRKPITFEAALEAILKHVNRGEVETVPLSEADGRYLAEDLVADHEIPPFDRSAFDGYALRSVDTQTATFDSPQELRVIESVAAGQVARQHLKSGEAMRIMTGAKIPDGADAILALELAQEVKKDGETWIRFNRPVTKGMHIAYTGEDTQQGTVLAPKGRKIGPGEKAILATFGYAQVSVYQQPVVGIYATGTELLPVDAPLAPGKIRNSNSYMLESQIRQIGARPKFYGILPDDYETCYQAFRAALDEVDYLLTTGGASVGDFDHIQRILADLEADVLFNKVAMRPGSVTTVAVKDNKWIFGLSGNPAACFIGFELFARPVLRYAQGSSDLHLPRVKARLKTDISKPNRFARFMRAKLDVDGSQLCVEPVGLDKSSVVSAIVNANGLLYLPPNYEDMAKGNEVDVLVFDQPWGTTNA
jgi:molybdopterin molybdotransferase